MRASIQRVVSNQITLTRRYLDRTWPGGDIVHRSSHGLDMYGE